MSHEIKAVGAVFIALILIFGAIPGMLCWPYVLNTWLEFGGKEGTVTWWQGGLMGCVPYLGQATIPAAIVTWILMLFIG